MRNITKIVLISITIYSCIIGLTLYLGDLWMFLTFIAVLGLGYDIHSYIRLRNGKPIITFQGLFGKKPEHIDANSGFYIGDKENRKRQNANNSFHIGDKENRKRQ